jgi:hypothetical protein
VRELVKEKKKGKGKRKRKKEGKGKRKRKRKKERKRKKGVAAFFRRGEESQQVRWERAGEEVGEEPYGLRRWGRNLRVRR